MLLPTAPRRLPVLLPTTPHPRATPRARSSPPPSAPPHDAAPSALAAEDRSGALDGPNSNTGAAKTTKRRPWKKLIAGAKKLHKGRKSRDAGEADDASVRGGNAEAEAAGSLSRRGTADQRAGAVAEDAVPREPDSSIGSSRRSQDIAEIDAAPAETEAPVGLTEAEEDKEEKAGILADV